jgi:hypothetical protein
MISSAPAPTPEDFMVAKLRSIGITKAAIIDDAFDLPCCNDVSEQIEDFWQTITADDSMLAKLTELKPEVSAPSDFDDKLLRILWERREDLPELDQPIKELFRAKLDDQKQLEELSAHLKTVGIDSVKLGSQDELSEHLRLVFLDYHLGPEAAAGDVARSKAMSIYKQAADEDKPFIVLMSARPDASLAKDDFREKASLLGGLFGFFSKGDFSNRDKLYMYLATWAICTPTAYEIQHFADAVEIALSAVTDKFVRTVRSLNRPGFTGAFVM